MAREYPSTITKAYTFSVAPSGVWKTPAYCQSTCACSPDIEFTTALRQIADEADLNLIIPEERIYGKTSLVLRDVTWRQAFTVLLAPINYTYIEDQNLVRIVACDDVRQFYRAPGDN